MREVLGLKKRKRKADCTSEVIPSTKSVGGQALTSEGSPGIGEASGQLKEPLNLIGNINNSIGDPTPKSRNEVVHEQRYEGSDEENKNSDIYNAEAQSNFNKQCLIGLADCGDQCQTTE